MRRPFVALFIVLVASLAAAAPLRAEEDASAMLASLAGADPGLRTYRADVAFDVGLRSFPYLRRSLHGNAYFKRPARMELVFSDLPPIARAWSNLYVGLGSPSEWEKKFSITSAADAGGVSRERHLLLTPRVADKRLRTVEVYVDRVAALPDRIVWQYSDGRIEMLQRFARVDGHDVVVAQDADIRLPAVHAYVHARITNYAVNIEVDDTVFTPKRS
jgi:hypothetical protein